MYRGWGLVAKQIAKRGVGLVANFGPHLVGDLLYVLQLLGFVKTVFTFQSGDSVNKLRQLLHGSEKPCIVFAGNSVDPLDFYYFLRIPNCIVLVTTDFITALPVQYLHYIPCVLWNMSYHVDVPWVAHHYQVIDSCMRHERQALLTQGPILCDGIDDVCCDISLYGSHWLSFGSIVVGLQHRFRRRRYCAQVIQRVVKQWLYRPDAGLGKKIVFRLNNCTK